MSRTVIYYNNVQLARINPAFATTYPGWTQRVEAIFTENKSEPIWKNSPTAGGVMLSATVREKNRFLNGIIAIDLSTYMTPVLNLSIRMPLGSEGENLKSQLVASKPTFDDVRSKIFSTLAHELLHVLQGWVYGGEDKWNQKYVEAWRDAQGKSFFENLFKPASIVKSESGYKNRFELAAFRFGGDFVLKNSAALKSGAFDEYIPVEMIKEAIAGIKIK